MTSFFKLVLILMLLIGANKSYTQVYYNSNALGTGSSALGVGNTATGAFSITAGLFNQATGYYSNAMGYRSEATGNYSMTKGYYSRATGTHSYSFGQRSVVSGIGAYAFGYYSGGSGNNAFSIGNFSTANSNNSFSIGEYVSTSSSNSYVLGRGFSTGFKLNNNISNSLMIGFNSNVPTLFVSASSGSGTYGKVGIGNITNPLTTLDVNGKITMRDGAVANYISVSDANGTMIWTDPASLGLGSVWQANSSDIYFNTGRVGIGTDAPQGKLQIQGSSGEQTQGQIHIVGNGEGGPGDAYISFYEGAEGGSKWSAGVKDNDNAFSISHGLTMDAAPKFVIAEATGNVGIGTSNPAAKLDVNGHLIVRTSASTTPLTKAFAIKDNVSGLDVLRVMSDGHIYATELTIKLKEDFPDYVFSKNYELMPLKQLGNYIVANEHLPNIPSANEVEENGLSIGEMQVKQMEKIEELTLYILELNQRMELLEEENSELKKK